MGDISFFILIGLAVIAVIISVAMRKPEDDEEGEEKRTGFPATFVVALGIWALNVGILYLLWEALEWFVLAPIFVANMLLLWVPVKLGVLRAMLASLAIAGYRTAFLLLLASIPV